MSTTVTTGVYFGAGKIYENPAMGSSTTLDNLKASQFDELTLGGMHILDSGDIAVKTSNGYVTIVSGGSWVSNTANNAFISNLKNIESSFSKMSIFFSDQGYNSFEALYSVMYPTGNASNPVIFSGDALYENFTELFAKLPMLSTINYDYEGTSWTTNNVSIKAWSSDIQDMLANFGQMLNDIGYGVSYCPPSNEYTFWNNCYKKSNTVQSKVGSNTPYAAFKVNAFYIQCYGTASVSGWTTKGNYPSDQTTDFIKAGVKITNCGGNGGKCPNGVQQFFNNHAKYGINTGWIWNYKALYGCQGNTTSCNGNAGGNGSQYAQAIVNGFEAYQKSLSTS